MASSSSGATVSRLPNPLRPHDGDLMLRIDPREDGTPLRVEVRSLTEALTEVARVLTVYSP
jgi:hypothetical protein